MSSKRHSLDPRTRDYLAFADKRVSMRLEPHELHVFAEFQQVMAERFPVEADRPAVHLRFGDLHRDAAVVGVVGGMGPLSDVALLQSVQPADWTGRQVHLWCQPAPAEHSGEIRDKRAWAAWGRDLERFLRSPMQAAMIACNTAHVRWSWMNKVSHAGVDHLVAEIAGQFPSSARVLVLQSRTARRLKLYPRALDARGVDWVEPSDEEQEQVHRAIVAVKEGREVPDLAPLVARHAASHVLAGCTELGIALRDHPKAFDTHRFMASHLTRRLEGLGD